MHYYFFTSNLYNMSFVYVSEKREIYAYSRSVKKKLTVWVSRKAGVLYNNFKSPKVFFRDLL